MGELKYFRDETVSMFITPGVKESIPAELCMKLFSLAFQRAVELERKDMETSYFQLFTIKASPYKGMFTRCDVTMEQEQPDYETQHKVMIMGNFIINERLYLIESWNGKTKNVTPEDHYITLLLPEEY